MGGKFYVNDAGRPCFLQSGSQVEEEIKTGIIPGMKLVINSNPKELIPGEYTYIGTISDRNVKFSRVISYTQDHVETYAGEFVLGLGGSITFPTSIRWDGETWDYFMDSYPYGIEDITYQYIVCNGLGKIIPYYSADYIFDGQGDQWNGTFRARGLE